MSESLSTKTEFDPVSMGTSIEAANNPTDTEFENWVNMRRSEALAPYFEHAHRLSALPQEVVASKGRLTIATLVDGHPGHYYVDGAFRIGRTNINPIELIFPDSWHAPGAPFPLMNDFGVKDIIEFYEKNYDADHLAPVKTYPGMFPLKYSTQPMTVKNDEEVSVSFDVLKSDEDGVERFINTKLGKYRKGQYAGPELGRVNAGYQRLLSFYVYKDDEWQRRY